MPYLKYAGIIGLSLTLATTWAGEDQSSGNKEAQEKPYIFTSQSMQISAVVEAINHESRVVTLRGPQGNTVTLTVDEKARNLGQVEVGDIVNTEYVQSLSQVSSFFYCGSGFFLCPGTCHGERQSSNSNVPENTHKFRLQEVRSDIVV